MPWHTHALMRRGFETQFQETDMSIVLPVRGDYIQLDQVLKATGLSESGGAAHAAIAAGQVRVDGQTETRKRAKLRPGQRVSFGTETVDLISTS